MLRPVGVRSGVVRFVEVVEVWLAAVWCNVKKNMKIPKLHIRRFCKVIVTMLRRKFKK